MVHTNKVCFFEKCTEIILTFRDFVAWCSFHGKQYYTLENYLEEKYIVLLRAKKLKLLLIEASTTTGDISFGSCKCYCLLLPNIDDWAGFFTHLAMPTTPNRSTGKMQQRPAAGPDQLTYPKNALKNVHDLSDKGRP